MKLLIASAAFYPENSPRSFRATELAKEFAMRGIEVSLITIARGPELKSYCSKNGIVLKPIRKIVLKDITVSSGRFGWIQRILKRLLLMLFEYPEIELAYRFKQALQREDGYDLLISIAAPYPVHWGVAWARSNKHQIAKTWIADCGDPYMGNQSDSFKRFFYFGFLEKWMFRKANKIAIPIEAAQDAYFKEFHKKISVIPQGLNFEEMSANRRTYSENEVITFAYAGSFIPGKRDPRKLLEYLISLPHDFRFFIFTNMQSWLSEYEQKSKGRILLRPYVSRTELIGQLSKMDFLINIENSTTTQAPSKLIDYYLAARPVLVAFTNDAKEDIVNEFLARDYTHRHMFENYDKFRIQNVCDQFLEISK